MEADLFIKIEDIYSASCVSSVSHVGIISFYLPENYQLRWLKSEVAFAKRVECLCVLNTYARRNAWKKCREYQLQQRNFLYSFSAKFVSTTKHHFLLLLFTPYFDMLLNFCMSRWPILAF